MQIVSKAYNKTKINSDHTFFIIVDSEDEDCALKFRNNLEYYLANNRTYSQILLYLTLGGGYRTFEKIRECFDKKKPVLFLQVS